MNLLANAAVALNDILASNPPKNVADAARQCCQAIAMGDTPSRELIDYVVAWVGRNNRQDRYGK